MRNVYKKSKDWRNDPEWQSPSFEEQQERALRFCQVLYGLEVIPQRPIHCFVPGCTEGEIYNSGACKKHAF